MKHCKDNEAMPKVAIAGTTTRHYYDDQRVAVQTLVSGGVETDDRYFVFGNYIDEVLVMHAGTDDLYYAHDHLYSPVALFAANGTVAERYEYDAYGKVQILTANYEPRPTSSLANPYYFTGRELDTLDAGSCKLMYYRARTYDPETGRFMQRDPLGVNSDGGFRGFFNPQSRYKDGANLYQYVLSSPMGYLDFRGEMANKLIVTSLDDCCGAIAEWETPGADWALNGWNWWDSRLRFTGGSGRAVEFNATSEFSAYVKNNLRGPWRESLSTQVRYKVASYTVNVAPDSCERLRMGFPLVNYSYYSDGSWRLSGTIGSGNDDEFSDILVNMDCCIKKGCCIKGGMSHIKYNCKAQITIRDLYGYHYYPDQAKKGKNFWTIIHFFNDYSGEFNVTCR